MFDASKSTTLPPAVGDAGAREAVKTGWGSANGRRAAGLQIEYSPSAAFAGLAVSAKDYRDTFTAEDFPPEPELVAVTLRASRGSSIVLQVEDSNGDLFETTHRPKGNDWQDLKPRFNAEMKGWKLVTRVDGKLNSQIRSVVVGIRSIHSVWAPGSAGSMRAPAQRTA